jgi:DNA-binding SARP family transcriptional activator
MTAATCCLLRVTVLGAPHLSTVLGPIAPTKTVVYAAALYLGLNRGHVTRRGELARLIWPDADGSTHGERIRWLVHQLKRAGLSFAARDPQLGLRTADVVLDIDLLDAPRWTDDILGIPQGDVLAGYDPQISDVFDRWVSDTRDAMRARVLHDLKRWLAVARAETLWWQTELLARRILLLDEYHEDASIALAESLALQGRRRAAVEVLGRHHVARWEGDPVPVSALLRERLHGHREAARACESKGTPCTLVGRANHLARILDAPANTSTQRIGVAGPAGIGKSRLLDEVGAVSALRGVQVQHIRCAREDVLRPRSLVADLVATLREARGGLGASPDTLERLRLFVADTAAVADAPASDARAMPLGSPAGVFSALAELLGAVADDGPLTIIIDDVHHAAPSSWSILSLLFPLVFTNAVTWLVALGAESQRLATRQFHAIFPPDEATCDQSRDLHWLSPLSDEAVRELCVTLAAPREMPADALALIVDRAVGVPFFAEALMEQWCSTGQLTRVPPAVARLTQARLDHMGATAEIALATIALLQREATFPAVEAVSMLSRRTLITSTRLLEDAGIVVLDHGALHAAEHWRAAVMERTPRTTWQFLQRAAAEWRDSLRPSTVRGDVGDRDVMVSVRTASVADPMPPAARTPRTGLTPRKLE